MGLITGFLLKKVAVAAGAATVHKVNKKHGEKAVKENLTFENYIYADKKILRRSFKVYDSNSKNIYDVSISSDRCELYDDEGVMLGEVQLFKGVSEYNYNIFLNNDEYEIERKNSINSECFLKEKKWTIKIKSLFDIVVKNKDGEDIIKIHDLFDKERVIIEFKNEKDEQLALIIFATLRIGKSR